MGLPTLRDAVGLKKEVKSEPAAPRRVVMGMETCEDLQRELLRPWKSAVPEEGAKLHYGAVLHALVQHATESFGPTWPNDLIILCTSACERQDLLTLQRGAKRLVGVLCTETHCFAQKGCPQVLLADGLEEAGILEAARAFLLHLADRWPGQYNIEVMPQLRQNDGWSWWSPGSVDFRGSHESLGRGGRVARQGSHVDLHSCQHPSILQA